ncbi:unnamed protein product (macronuclear) [Paramecium tetraurelia]|uniref:Uncharacterized protein n=1 Tax=Paramecium tetraurelia TaxID=5888 RepID=A0CE36_PARTE|nr:uncharacterized protein GSPATT00007265001 [Paramecium tetraurelia]CAK69053.1 unnamed protein product [Paramecium tetraurelia]|eukprot:XP_001436450.1 hypothetical protein (macronuclear) [Paramecium tetraurelia strain d4-2]
MQQLSISTNKLIPHLMSKLEQLIQEIQKLTKLSNSLMDNLQVQEIQYKNLQYKYQQVWNQLSDEQKIKFNLNQISLIQSHIEPTQLSNLISNIETKVLDLKHYRQNSQPIILPVVHQCLECKKKEEQIQELNETLEKIEIQKKKSKTSFSTRLNTEFSLKDNQNQYQQFTTKSNYQKNNF